LVVFVFVVVVIVVVFFLDFACRGLMRQWRWMWVGMDDGTGGQLQAKWCFKVGKMSDLKVALKGEVIDDDGSFRMSRALICTRGVIALVPSRDAARSLIRALEELVASETATMKC
jgi:hypothetical protein